MQVQAVIKRGKCKLKLVSLMKLRPDDDLLNSIPKSRSGYTNDTIWYSVQHVLARSADKRAQWQITPLPKRRNQDSDRIQEIESRK